MTPKHMQKLAQIWHQTDDTELLETVLNQAPVGRVAVVTSFGVESAVLLDMVARIDRTVPIVFVDTGQLFAETLAYRGQLVERLGLTDVRTIQADREALAKADPDGSLYRSDPDACCAVRKVAPFAHALSGFDIEITGRKRFQGGARSNLQLVEVLGNRLKINPLAWWSTAAIEEAFSQRGLPRHPLFFNGYRSVGCAVCTRRSCVGEPVRAGRWSGSSKTECGIHFASSISPTTLPSLTFVKSIPEKK